MDNHYISMENRNALTITEVKAVESFDEEGILVELAEENIIVNGKGIHIEILDLEEGKLIASGEFDNISYVKKHLKNKLFSRFRR